jgi:hypothetical protein
MWVVNPEGSSFVARFAMGRLALSPMMSFEEG